MVKMNYELLNGNNLAYIGDAVFELHIRKYLIDKGLTKSNDLRKASIRFVSADAHEIIVKDLLSEMTAKEMDIFKRGRNNSSLLRSKEAKTRKHQLSSGFEAVIGYCYLMNDQTRIDFLIASAIEAIEKRESHE